MSRVGVRYIIDDVPSAIRFYTTLLGFTLEIDASPAFASVARDGVRLLLSGDGSSGKRTLEGRHPQVVWAVWRFFSASLILRVSRSLAGWQLSISVRRSESSNYAQRVYGSCRV